MSATDLEFVLGQLAKFRGVVSRPMFGGHGLYQDGVFFGLIDRSGVLYFHTDKVSRERFLDAGSEPFEMGGTGKKPARYWEVPEEVLENPVEVAKWAKVACATALEFKKPKKLKRKKKATAKKGAERISSMRNLGPVTERWCNKVGVMNRGDLEETGSLATYVAVIKAGWSPNLNLLWALEGALLDLDILKLPPPVKDSLLQRLERLEE